MNKIENISFNQNINNEENIISLLKKKINLHQHNICMMI